MINHVEHVNKYSYYKNYCCSDLKPENVMLLSNDGSLDVVGCELIDYGIAKSLKNLSSHEEYIVGKGHFGTKGKIIVHFLLRPSLFLCSVTCIHFHTCRHI